MTQETEKTQERRPLVEAIFESFLWNTRFIVILPIICSLVSSIIMFIIGSKDVLDILFNTFRYLQEGSHNPGFHTDVIITIMGATDIYLIAIVLLIFSFGIYTLFISAIDEADNHEASRILDIHSLDSLKDKLSQVIVMALIVKFFQMIFTMYKQFTTPVDMLYLSLSILGLSVGLYFLYNAKGHGKHN